MSLNYIDLKIAILNCASNINKEKQGENMSTDFHMTAFSFADVFSIGFTEYEDGKSHASGNTYAFDSRTPEDVEVRFYSTKTKKYECRYITQEAAIREIGYECKKRGVDIDEFI